MSVQEAIRYANSLLPGRSAPEGESDPRWQAIIDVAEFIPIDPEEVWSFIARWGVHRDEDLRAAIATCLLEHLLEDHFLVYFPRIQRLANDSQRFADTFLLCMKFGQTLEPGNSVRFDALKKELTQTR
jgi:hypothetical protein